MAERQYHEILVEGTQWKDKVCLDFNEIACVNNFEFFLIEKQTFMKEPIDGFLGLGRNEPFVSGSLANLKVQRGPSFLNALRKAGQINKEIFSILLTKPKS